MDLLLSKCNMPCAACKHLRRRCSKECIFLPYFSPSELQKFAAVHRVFGASNISRLLQDIPVSDREDAVTSMVYEATARLRNPVYGCVSMIASLQKQVLELQSRLNAVHAEAMALSIQLSDAFSTQLSAAHAEAMASNIQLSDAFSGLLPAEASPSTNLLEELMTTNVDFHQQQLNEWDNDATDSDAMLLLRCVDGDCYQVTDP